MNVSEYKAKLFDIVLKYNKFSRGAKYVRHWDIHFSEKEFIVERAKKYGFLDNVNTAIDIGTGVGMLPYVLMQEGIHVEATDIEEEITGPIFRECCDLLELNVHHMYIYNNKPMKFPGNYDLLIASRTEFDREFLTPGEQFNWQYFLDDAFQYVNKVFIKTNNAGSGKGYPKYLRKYLWNPQSEGLGKPYRAWYVMVDKKDWVADTDKLNNNSS